MYNNIYHSGNLSTYSFLVTGGAGFIGSNLVEYLIKYGAGKVRVLDNFSTGFKRNITAYLDHPAFDLMEGDIRDMETCRAAVEGMDYVSHQAAMGSVPRSVSDPVTTNQVNVDGFLNMLWAVRNAGCVKRMVYAASSSVYGDSKELPKEEEKIGRQLSPYAVSKFANELYAGVFSRVYNLHTLGLRYFNVFGPRQDPAGPYAAVIPLFMKAAITGQSPRIFGDGEQKRDFTFIENAVQANIKGMFHSCTLDKHEAINVAYARTTTINDLWLIINKIANTDILPQYVAERKGDIRDSLANIDKAFSLIGYKPVFSVGEGLKQAFPWYREFYKNNVDTFSPPC